MSASKECKALGLKSVVELSEITGEPRSKINRWYCEKHDLFKVVLLGAVETKKLKLNDGSKTDE